MADEYQSTDRLSTDTVPETPRLLAEGTVHLQPADFSAVTGGFQASVDIDLTQINDIGNNTKDAYGSYKVEVWHSFTVISNFNVFRPLPFTLFSNFSTGAVDREGHFQVSNDGTAGGGIFTSTLTITYFADSNAGSDGDDAGDQQTFHYKVWSVPFES